MTLDPFNYKLGGVRKESMSETERRQREADAMTPMPEYRPSMEELAAQRNKGAPPTQAD